MNETNSFSVECLGEQEEWVYDIEVENNHNFFANDILVHNSVYLQLGDIAEKAWSCDENLSMDEKVSRVDKICEEILKPQINELLDTVTSTYNALQPELMDEDREAIADCIEGKTILKLVENGSVTSTTIKSLSNRFISKSEKTGVHYIEEDIKILSIREDGTKELKRVVNIQKKQTSEKMVTLRNGDISLTCTENHKIAILVNGKIEYKEAKNITEDDDVQLYTKYQGNDHCKLYSVKPPINPMSNKYMIEQGMSTAEILHKRKTIQSKRKATAHKTHIKKRAAKKLLLDNRILRVYNRYGIRSLILFYRVSKYTARQIYEKVVNLVITISFKEFNKLVKNITYSDIVKKQCDVCSATYGTLYYSSARACSKRCQKILRSNNSGMRKHSKLVYFLRRADKLSDKYNLQKIKDKKHSEYSKYKYQVIKETNKTLKMNILKDIDKRGKYTGCMNVDHIYPIKEGFINHIPPIIIGHISNLQMLDVTENRKKRCTVDIIPNIILDYIKEANERI